MTDKICGTHCFTLLERLIKISEIAIFAGLLLPSLKRAQPHTIHAEYRYDDSFFQNKFAFVQPCFSTAIPVRLSVKCA